MTLDKHRDSLAKYCYDLSKVVLAIAVFHPMVAKSLDVTGLASGVALSSLFLSLAILIEEGERP